MTGELPRLTIPLILLAFSLGCGDSTPPRAPDGDAGRVDAGLADAGSIDAAASDSGTSDSGSRDSGSISDAGAAPLGLTMVERLPRFFEASQLVAHPRDAARMLIEGDATSALSGAFVLEWTESATVTRIFPPVSDSPGQARLSWNASGDAFFAFYSDGEWLLEHGVGADVTTYSLGSTMAPVLLGAWPPRELVASPLDDDVLLFVGRDYFYEITRLEEPFIDANYYPLNQPFVIEPVPPTSAPTDIAPSPTDASAFYLSAADGVRRCQALGTTPLRCEDVPLPGVELTGSSRLSFAFPTGDANVVHLTVTRGTDSTLHVSHDGAASFDTQFEVTGLVTVSPTQPDRIAMTRWGEPIVRRSVDGGRTWTDYSTPPRRTLLSMPIAYDAAGVLYVGIADALYRASP